MLLAQDNLDIFDHSLHYPHHEYLPDSVQPQEYLKYVLTHAPPGKSSAHLRLECRAGESPRLL